MIWLPYCRGLAPWENPTRNSNPTVCQHNIYTENLLHVRVTWYIFSLIKNIRFLSLKNDIMLALYRCALNQRDKCELQRQVWCSVVYTGSRSGLGAICRWRCQFRSPLLKQECTQYPDHKSAYIPLWYVFFLLFWGAPTNATLLSYNEITNAHSDTLLSTTPPQMSSKYFYIPTHKHWTMFAFFSVKPLHLICYSTYFYGTFLMYFDGTQNWFLCVYLNIMAYPIILIKIWIVYINKICLLNFVPQHPATLSSPHLPCRDKSI